MLYLVRFFSIIIVSLILFGFNTIKVESYKEAVVFKCGPIIYADNSAVGYAPEMNNITIANSQGSNTYYVCCGNDGYLTQVGGSFNLTITVVVENDWSGGSAKVGIRKYDGTVLQCQQYSYGQGTYTFYFTPSDCGAYTIFTDGGLC
jgi:hypothetical protein